MNQIYRLVALVSLVIFTQGCEILMPIFVVGAVTTLPSLSSDKSGSKAVENSESSSASTALSDAVEKPVAYVDDISGTYISELTESGSRTVFDSKYRKTEITLWQDGNAITGTDKSGNMEINGTREGSTIRFYIIGGYQIDGVWEINADASKLVGKWSTDGGGGASGKWNLMRVSPSVSVIENKAVPNPASENQPATRFDVSGTYVSDRINTNWALRNKAILRIKLEQNLNSIEGNFIESLNGPIRGTIVEDKVEITWEAGNCNSGEGTLSMDPEGSILQGFLLCRSQGMRKYDIVFRRNQSLKSNF